MWRQKKIILFASLAGFLILPKISLAATLYLSPASGSFAANSSFNISVKTNTQGQAVNTAEASVTYDPNLLELVKVAPGSSFTLQSPGSPYKTTGQAYFSAGIPTPGYNGSSGTLGVMTFRAKSEGTAQVSIVSGKVLLNDGSGTDALTGTSAGTYSITPKLVTTGGPTVTSQTHPNEESWYTSTTSVISWDRPNNVYGYSFELNQVPDTIPDDTLDTTVTQNKSYENLNDGIWYFHIKAKSQKGAFGQIQHFKIQIDTQRPLQFDASLVEQNNLNDVNRTPRIRFAAKDELSGIVHYSIYLDENLIEANAQSPYNFSTLQSGPHKIKVIAYDKANNERKSELSIIVTGHEALIQQIVGLFQNFQFLLLILLSLNFIILLLILILLWKHYKKQNKMKEIDPVSALQTQIDSSIDDLKKHVDASLLKFVKKHESSLAQTINQNIDQTKNRVDQQITRLKKARKK